MFKFLRVIRSRLTWYLTICVMISGVIGVLVAYLCYYGGNIYVEKISDDQQKNKELQVRYLEELQEFVDKKEILPSTISELVEWTNENDSVYLSVYQSGKIIFNSDNAYDSYIFDESEGTEYQDIMEEIYSDYLYRLFLADGSVARVDLFCYDFWKYYNYVLAISTVIGLMVFTVILTRLIHRKINYINEIVRELQILEGGNLEYPVTVRGKDELANLATGIDQMRLSIIENMEKEQKMLQSNKDLVTSMSHDLRTPLTTLTGYLELLNMKDGIDEEKRKRYLKLSLSKTQEIKQLSDDLFSYFLIYGKDEDYVDVEAISAYALSEDLIQNQILDLEEEGYQVEGKNDVMAEDGNCMINVSYMQRVLNNIVSNLRKYAEREKPVVIHAYMENEKMVISVCNVISTQMNPHESTKIGIITCERIMRLHGGEFITIEENGTFTTKIIIPMEEKEC